MQLVKYLIIVTMNLFFAYPCLVFAIGDSGGCTGVDSLYREAANGSAESLNFAIENAIESRSLAIDKISNFIISIREKIPLHTKLSKIKDGCGSNYNPNAFLRIAIESGNRSTTQYLLSLGINPSAPFYTNNKISSTVFTKCEKAADFVKTKPRKADRLATFAMAIDHLGNLFSRQGSDVGALAGCPDSDIVNLFIERGLRPNDWDFKQALLTLKQAYISTDMDYRAKLLDESQPWERLELFINAGYSPGSEQRRLIEFMCDLSSYLPVTICTRLKNI